MWTTAQVEELTLFINSDHALLRQSLDKFQLIGISQLAKNVQSFLAANFFTYDRQILGYNTFHFLLDLQQIFRIQWMLQIHIVEEAIFNHRTHAKLNFFGSEQPSDRLGHQVSCTVTHNFQTFRRIQNHDFYQCALF